MRDRVVVFVGPDHDLYHTSRFFTGLTALHQWGEIALQYRVPRDDDRWLVADPVVVCFDIGEKPRKRVAVDLRDGPGVSWAVLERVDRYFKRAFSRDETATFPPAIASRMAPFGLNYGCRSTRSMLSVLSHVGFSIARRGRPGIQRLRQYLATLPPAAFEQGPNTDVAPKVMFQTRLWSADEIPAEEVAPLNESRVAMVRALKTAFGDRFVGGLVPTRFALSQYPDEVTPHSSRYAAYLALKKSCLVSVYTRGVEHSLAFKLGETIAASQCLVSVPLKYELPTPLIEGRHYLGFTTPDEAVAACERLLADRELAIGMRRANHAYYKHEVEPGAHVGNVLARCQS